MEKKKSWTKSKLGAFWIKKTKDDRQYLSGVIDIQLPDGSVKKVALAIYKNDFKLKELKISRLCHFEAFDYPIDEK